MQGTIWLISAAQPLSKASGPAHNDWACAQEFSRAGPCLHRGLRQLELLIKDHCVLLNPIPEGIQDRQLHQMIILIYHNLLITITAFKKQILKAISSLESQNLYLTSACCL